MPLKVNEIFCSIQGESSYAGRPCVFVRLAGCNLRCSYCDTQYAYKEGIEMTIDEIMDIVVPCQCRIIEVTGGEPLVQRETPNLIDRLLEDGFEVLLETNGSLDISCIDERCARIVDIKCPSSGQEKENDLLNLSRLTDKDEIKFVIGSRDDYEYAKKILSFDFSITNPPLFSPLSGEMSPQLLAEWILEDHLDVRLNMQLHKIIWEPERRAI